MRHLAADAVHGLQGFHIGLRIVGTPHARDMTGEAFHILILPLPLSLFRRLVQLIQGVGGHNHIKGTGKTTGIDLRALFKHIVTGLPA